MRYQYLLIAFLFSLCANANAEWFLRGSHNAWASTQMESAGAGTNTMQLKNVVFAKAGNIKFDRFGDWKENYGLGGLNGGNIPVAAGTWNIKFFTNTKKWDISAASISSSSSSRSSSSSSSRSILRESQLYQVRGTFNDWQEGTFMFERTDMTDSFERCINFVGGDANGGPRFRVDRLGAFGDITNSFPATDFVVKPGWVLIKLNIVFHQVGAIENLGANCTTPSSSPSSSSSSAPATAYHVRGTFNSWNEGTLMNRIGSSDNYVRCVNFPNGTANSGPRFKIDPNGGWGNDSAPAADFAVTAGWVKIIFNSTNKAITAQQNLSTNCTVIRSSSSTSSSSAAASSSSVSSDSP